MKNKKIFSILIMLVLVLAFCIPAFALTSEGVPEAVEPSTNFYYIIEGCWSYIFPAEVIEANSNIIAFFTMILTMAFVLVPFIIIFSVFRKKR